MYDRNAKFVGKIGNTQIYQFFFRNFANVYTLKVLPRVLRIINSFLNIILVFLCYLPVSSESTDSASRDCKRAASSRRHSLSTTASSLEPSASKQGKQWVWQPNRRRPASVLNADKRIFKKNWLITPKKIIDLCLEWSDLWTQEINLNNINVDSNVTCLKLNSIGC